MLELRHYRYFLAVARSLHVTRAAESLHIAQPALSQNIHQLEAEVGVPLFTRYKRRLALTAAGEAFLPQAERCLKQFEEAQVAAKRAARGEIGKIAIGFGSTAALGAVPRLVRAFRKRYVEPELILRELGADDQVNALRRGEIDLGLVYSTLPGDEFAMRLLEPERLIAVLPSTHRLAVKARVAVKDLAHEAFVLPMRSYSGSLLDGVSAECEAAGFSPRSTQQVTTVQVALSLVSAGLGVSLLPQSISAMHRDGVVFRPLRSPRVHVHLRLFWRKGDDSPVLKNVLSCI